MGMFKILTTFTTVIEAEIAQLLLEEYGISSTVLDTNLAYSLGSTYSQGIRLQVKEEDYERALRIYQASLDKSENDLDYT
jgi:hypothetical protein